MRAVRSERKADRVEAAAGAGASDVRAMGGRALSTHLVLLSLLPSPNSLSQSFASPFFNSS